MRRQTYMNPRTCVLSFEMFRSFAPLVDTDWSLKSSTPPCDLYETDTAIVLKMELPDMRKEDISVTLENSVLTVRGECRFKNKMAGENHLRIERRHGQFVRSFTVPASVEVDKIVAEFNSGMLTIKLPKNGSTLPRQIEVK